MENVSNQIKCKGEIIFNNGNVRKEMETDRRIHFVVNGESEEHFVIFDKKTNSWNCDCRYYALNQKECSHIIASKMKQKSIG